jgi:lysozyme
MRQVNVAGLELIKKWEGLRLEAYVCPAGKLTIGWGHTGPEVVKGMRIPLELADRLFRADVTRHSLGLESFVTAPVTPNQWAALVSLCFNMGISPIGTSTLVRKLNDGHAELAAECFMDWVHVNSAKPGEPRKMVVSKGLLFRRGEEQALFLSGTSPRVA